MENGIPQLLWDGVAPGSESWTHAEQDLDLSGPHVRNVVVPTLMPHLPPGGAAAGPAVLVCPGGAFYFLSMQNEGHAVAEFLAARGVAAFVLKYRVVPTPADDEGFGVALRDAFMSGGLEGVGKTILPLALADGDRALDLIRAEGYEHVTVLGFSAGARLAAEMVLRGTAARPPDAAGIVYLPTMADTVATSDSPPLFVLAAADDPLGIDGSLVLHEAWRAAERPVELHLFERGGHGFGFAPQGLPSDQWSELFLAWHATLST